MKSKQPAVDLELREGDPNELSIAEAKSVRNPRKKKDAVELPDLPGLWKRFGLQVQVTSDAYT